MLHTESVFGTVEQSMYEIYEQNNQVIEGKLQELTEVLGRIGMNCTHCAVVSINNYHPLQSF